MERKPTYARITGQIIPIANDDVTRNNVFMYQLYPTVMRIPNDMNVRIHLYSRAYLPYSKADEIKGDFVKQFITPEQPELLPAKTYWIQVDTQKHNPARIETHFEGHKLVSGLLELLGTIIDAPPDGSSVIDFDMAQFEPIEIDYTNGQGTLMEQYHKLMDED